MQATESKLRRRTFMTAAVCAPAIAAAALMARKPAPAVSPAAAPAASPPAVEEPPQSRGYHETEHIRQYYASAAF